VGPSRQSSPDPAQLNHMSRPWRLQRLLRRCGVKLFERRLQTSHIALLISGLGEEGLKILAEARVIDSDQHRDRVLDTETADRVRTIRGHCASRERETCRTSRCCVALGRRAAVMLKRGMSRRSMKLLAWAIHHG